MSHIHECIDIITKPTSTTIVKTQKKKKICREKSVTERMQNVQQNEHKTNAKNS